MVVDERIHKLNEDIHLSLFNNSLEVAFIDYILHQQHEQNQYLLEFPWVGL